MTAKATGGPLRCSFTEISRTVHVGGGFWKLETLEHTAKCMDELNSGIIQGLYPLDQTDEIYVDDIGLLSAKKVWYVYQITEKSTKSFPTNPAFKV